MKSRPLSPRQREVSVLVARGLSNNEIADRLGITEGTVKLHVYQIFKRMKVRNRVQVAIKRRGHHV